MSRIDRFTKFLAAPAALAALVTAAPAAASAPAAEPCAPLHSATADYRAGDTVSHHGRNWSAKWWTRGGSRPWRCGAARRARRRG
ncbi:carbohydrate-binding protein, partial [Streptomyces sp. NE06-03C]|uniref:carbohydrate-binding protein n=1 Tax=Streptomyces sp. NE06-03C TaxID=3028694 RepID=UPI0039F497F7